MAGFYKSFKEFQEYYANKFQRSNPLPWQDGMQAIIWWITENIPENTQATMTVSADPTGVVISGAGTDDDPYIWAFNFNTSDVKGPKGDTGAQGPQGPQGPQGEQGPAGEDGTIVEANPAGTASGDLTKIGINGTVYNIPSGGSTLYKHTIYFYANLYGIYSIHFAFIDGNSTPITTYAELISRVFPNIYIPVTAYDDYDSQVVNLYKSGDGSTIMGGSYQLPTDMAQSYVDTLTDSVTQL